MRVLQLASIFVCSRVATSNCYLRAYPARFAGRVLQLVQQVKKEPITWNKAVPYLQTRGGPPRSVTPSTAFPAQVHTDIALHTVIFAMPCSTWAVAEVEGALRYVRGSYSLVVPEAFVGVFPTSLASWPDPVAV